LKWTWDFGDGSGPSTDQNPRHRYKKAGTYTVSLTVETATEVATVVKEDYIEVESERGLDADFTADPKIPPANTPVQFTDLSTDGKAITSWDWDFGDNTSSTQQHPSHTYTSVGKFTVSLTVTNNKGKQDTETKTDYINVQPVGPTANFSANPRNQKVGLPVQFTDISDPGTSPIQTWLWLFGDGGTSNQQSPSHIYTAVAQYTVYLRVTTVVGSDSETKVNYISITP